MTQLSLLLPEVLSSTTPGRSVRLKSTGHSSLRLGPCEICGQHVSEVFMRLTEDGLDYVFGHEQCLRVSEPDERSR